MVIPTQKINEGRRKYMNRCLISLKQQGVSASNASEICSQKAENDDFEPTEFALWSAIVKGIYDDDYNPDNLPADLYRHNYFNIQSKAVRSFGLPSGFAEKIRRYKTALGFKRNVNLFSGAKTFQEVYFLSQLIYDEGGQKRPFSQFKKIAEIVNDQYNVNYLKTEQNTAFAVGQGAEQWHDFTDEAEYFPYLQYVTVGDERVRAEHRAWDGIIRKVNDPFWNDHFPPNDWNCRCTVIQLESGTETNLRDHLNRYNKQASPDKRVPNLKNDSKTFSINPGKSNLIFGPKHSYFNVPVKYRKSMRGNFGLKQPTDEELMKWIENN